MPAITSTKTKAHQRYYTATGKIVPGVTTIIGSNLGWNKAPLIAWARKTALAGQDPNKIRDKAADIGTLAHDLVQEHITTICPHLEPIIVDKDEYSPANLKLAEAAYQTYLNWEKEKHVDLTSESVRSELQLVSEWYQYGGTLDFIVPINGVLTLVDFKTSDNIYAEHRIQLSAYRWLYEENFVEQVPTYILQLGKTNGRFHPYEYVDLTKEFTIFKHLRKIHDLHKAVK